MEYPDIDFDIFYMNSACNIPPMMTGLRTDEIKLNKIVIGLFDDDTTGNVELSNTTCQFPNKDNKNRHTEKYFAMLYPKHSSHNSKIFTVENFYENEIIAEAYKECLETILRVNKGKSLESINGSLEDAVKTAIFEKSKHLIDKEDFKYFRGLFDKIKEIKIFCDELGSTKANSMAKDVDAGVTAHQSKKLDFKEIYTNRRGTDIQAEYYNDKKIIVKAGSKLSKDEVKSCSAKLERKRTLEKVAEEVAEHWILKKDKIFDSVSAAINYATGGSMIGWYHWKLKENHGSLQTIR